MAVRILHDPDSFFIDPIDRKITTISRFVMGEYFKYIHFLHFVGPDLQTVDLPFSGIEM
jgi:hypothetical protein